MFYMDHCSFHARLFPRLDYVDIMCILLCCVKRGRHRRPVFTATGVNRHENSVILCAKKSRRFGDRANDCDFYRRVVLLNC